MTIASVLWDNLKKVQRSLRPTPIVSDNYRLLYFPIPKVASSSIKLYLLRNIFLTNYPVDLDHYTEQQIHRHTYPTTRRFSSTRYRQYFKLVIVRDPVSRIWSCYQDKIVNDRMRERPLRAGFERYNVLFRKSIFSLNMTFDDFVEAISRIPDIISDEHFRSQSRFLPHYTALHQHDFVCTMQNLDDTMLQLSTRLGLASWEKIKNNVSSANDQSPSNNSRKLIRARYRQDYKLIESMANLRS